MMTGEKLRAVRALKRISQAALSESSGVSETSIAEFERGMRDMRAANIVKLCTAMGVAVAYTVDGTQISGP